VLLTKTFDGATYARALEDWSWLELKGKTPVLSSLFGDVFLQDSTGYWFLDTLDGSLSIVGRRSRQDGRRPAASELAAACFGGSGRPHTFRR